MNEICAEQNVESPQDGQPVVARAAMSCIEPITLVAWAWTGCTSRTIDVGRSKQVNEVFDLEPKK